MPVTRKGLEASQKQSDETNALLRKILEQQEKILAALEKLAAK